MQLGGSATLRCYIDITWFLIDLQVNELEIFADHLSLLPKDVIYQLALKINKQMVVYRDLPPSDEIAYNEKLTYLQKLACSRGRPVS